MTIFDDLKQKWTPEMTKRAVELAEGFELKKHEIIKHSSGDFDFIDKIYDNKLLFPLLLHRAIEGWNKKSQSILIQADNIVFETTGCWWFEDYQPCHLTACEMAILDCLSEVLR